MIGKYYKFPRIFHADWSEGLQNDDRRIQSLDGFEGKHVVINEKIDGEGTMMSREHIHARSLDSKDHPSRHWVKALHAKIKDQIPSGWEVAGENVFATHSLPYDKLTSYFYVFGIFDGNRFYLPWDDVLEWCSLLGLEHAPVLYEGLWNIEKAKSFIPTSSTTSFFGKEREGYVCRIIDGFDIKDFDKYIMKVVRQIHVTTGDNWMYQPMTKNKLAAK